MIVFLCKSKDSAGGSQHLVFLDGEGRCEFRIGLLGGLRSNQGNTDSIMDKNHYFRKILKYSRKGDCTLLINCDMQQNGLAFQAKILKQEPHFCQKNPYKWVHFTQIKKDKSKPAS